MLFRCLPSCAILVKFRIQAIATVAAVNVLVLAVLAGAVELALGKWFERPVYCVDHRLHHAYCPGIVKYTLLSPEDGGARVENVIDRSRVRVPHRSLKDGITDVSQYDIINIGDSFIEADEIPYDETLSAVWIRLSGKRILQFGYGSWAPIIYYNWLLRQKLKPGVIVNLFIMENDVTPAVRTSNASYHKMAVRVKDGAFVFPGQDEHSLKNLIKQRSWFYERVYSRRYELNYYLSPMPQKWVEGDFSNPSSDCAKLDTLRKWLKGLSGYLTIDYLAFAFTPECWDEAQTRDVESAIEDINRIVELVTQVDGKVNVLFVPPGWSFPGENLISKADRAYLMKENTVITTEPLVEYMRGKIRARVISLEAVIKKLKAHYPGAWYFPKDGHWTPHAHRYLGVWLHENLR